jgi:methionyl-tRNA synthetase
MREIVFGQDGSFSFDALVQRFNSDLANGLGNLASRTLAMIQRYFDGEVPYPSATIAHTPAEAAIARLAEETIAQYNRLFDAYQFSRALETLWFLLSAVDKYIVENQPWAIAEKAIAEKALAEEALAEPGGGGNSRARLATILYTSAEALRIITVLAHPIIPDSTAKIFTQLGLGDISQTDLNLLRWGQLNVGTRLGRIEAVFPRADKSAIERMQQMEEQRKSVAATATAGAPHLPQLADVGTTAATAAASVPHQQPAAPHLPQSAATIGAPHQPQSADVGNASPSYITIDDFLKVELRVGTVLTAEKVAKADKLLRLTVDIGTEVRQIVAGIAKAYAPETLIGRKVVIVANLAPRKLRGVESQGMIVAASFGEEGQPALASFLEDVPNGARLK